MAIRLNTVEYAFPQIVNASFGPGAVQNFTPIVVEIPETSGRTFVSAFADIFTLDVGAVATSPTSWSFGLRCSSFGTGTFLNQTVTDTITNSGEHMSLHFLFDVSSQFRNNFTTNASYVIDASFALAVQSTNNTSCKLVLTYQYDDTVSNKIKTVRIPLESSTGALGSTLQPLKGTGLGGFDIPLLDSWLPEASKAYKDIFFETWVNEGTTADTTPNPSLGFALDSEAVSWDHQHMDTLVSARLYRRIWQRKDMTTNAQHIFKAQTGAATAANMPFRMLGSVLNVTYTYDCPSTNTVMNSIMLAAADEIGRPGSTTAADQSRFKRGLSIPDENPVLKESGIQFSFIDSAAVAINVAVGPQVTTQYSNAANVVCGGYMFMHNFDASSRKGAGITLSKYGSFTIDFFTGSQTAGSTGSNVSALMYLNYTSTKSNLPGGCSNHPHTIIPLFKPHTADTLLNPVNIQIIDIPETNRWITSICPVLSYYGGALPNDYVIYSAEMDTSTSAGAGWANLYVGQTVMDSEFSPIISYSRARKEFRRWPFDYDTERMYLEKLRSYRFERASTSYFGSYWPITYHTLTNYVSGAVTGYTGDGSGIQIKVFDDIFLNEVIYEGSTNIGGQWGFTWYNNDISVNVGAYQDSTHQGMVYGRVDTSLNISFGGATPTSWVF